MSEFLFEIGLEEIPARMIAAAEAELLRRVTSLLERERLIPAGAAAKSFSTPRRLAVLVHDVAERQEDIAEELTGPATKIAFKDGVPGPAAIAFAKKAGIAVEELKVIQTPKGEYIAATSVKPGRTAAEVLADELPKELSAIYWPKNMHWRPGRPSNPDRFVRPVRWLVALLGHTIVPVEFGGYTASDVTYGHRVLQGPAPVKIASPASYAKTLNEAFVMADVELRRHTIRKALDHVCRTITSPAGCRWREDHALVDKLTHLTEWPSVIVGAFDPEYLTLPEEVLVTVMRDHQNYFAVETKDGKLAAHFLAVLNTVPDERAAVTIQHGNARVLRARFNDARFFWEFDQRTPLAGRDELLHTVTFQKELGSYSQKLPRIKKIWDNLIHLPENHEQAVPVIVGVDEYALAVATQLCKSDLTCELVKEFTELQGIIGGLYAKEQGAGDCVKDAIYYHYAPQAIDAAIPPTIEGCLLSLADKADTIAGMFALGLEPSGSKDPFALRRAGNAIIKIIAENPSIRGRSLWFISRRAVLPYGTEIGYWQAGRSGAAERLVISVDQEAVTTKVHSFLRERLEFFLKESQGHAYDVVNAVLSTSADDVSDLMLKAKALSAMRGSEDFVAVCAAFKRIKNILRQAAGQNNEITSFIPVFPTQEETDLWKEIQSAGAGFLVDCHEQLYLDALKKLANLRPIIDRYFESVMVMAPDLELRANRLGMLRYLTVTFTQIADFSEIVTAG